jgi:hypothetical protein
MRCRSGVVAPIQQPVISVEQDLNTLDEDSLKRVYTPDEIRRFFEEAAAEASSMLALAFPEEHGS